MTRRTYILCGIAAFMQALATTVGLAWVFAGKDILDIGVESQQRMRPAKGPVEPVGMGSGPDQIIAAVHRDTGRVFVRTQCNGPSFAEFIGIPDRVRVSIPPAPPDELIPMWAREMSLPWLSGTWPRGADVDWREVSGSGWPMIALASEYCIAANRAYERRFGIELAGKRRVSGGLSPTRSPRMLPLRPVFPGFFVDVAAYAVAWWGLLMLPFAVCRWRRRRHGLCVRCGYDLVGLAVGLRCPECGAG